MENTFEFISVILAIWGVVELILFFKVWKMTNDVEKLKNKFVEGFNDEENGLYVNMDINSAVRKLYYLNNTEEAYALLNKYLYYKLIQPFVTNYLQGIAENSVSAYPSIKPDSCQDYHR